MVTSLTQSHVSYTPSRSSLVMTWMKSHAFFLNVCTFAGVIFCAGLYIAQINQSIGKGYEIRQLENAISELSLVNERLEMSARQAQSLDHVAKAVKMLSMVESKNPVYLDLHQPSVALNQ